MLKLKTTNRFEKDIRRMLSRGKSKNKIMTLMNMLVAEKPLEKRYKNHKLTGEYMHRHECHIEPDWLLIYKVQGGEIVFERTGTHADLFR